ncbi:MAG TPA: conjugal transfer protein [Symbiobacteriaceae bacterium]
MEKVRLRTYRQVWSQERVIYQIERVRLPFPVSFAQAGVFAVAEVVMAVLSRLPGIGATSPALRYLVIPGAVTWFLTKQRLDGKPPLRWALSMIRYLFSPKRLNRLRPMAEHPEHLRFRDAVGYRLKG